MLLLCKMTTVPRGFVSRWTPLAVSCHAEHVVSPFRTFGTVPSCMWLGVVTLSTDLLLGVKFESKMTPWAQNSRTWKKNIVSDSRKYGRYISFKNKNVSYTFCLFLGFIHICTDSVEWRQHKSIHPSYEVVPPAFHAFVSFICSHSDAWKPSGSIETNTET